MHMFVVTSSDLKSPSLARVRVYGLSVLQDAQRTLDFGAVDAGEAPKLEYAVQADDATVRIKSVKAVPAFVSAQIADDGRRLILTHSTTSAWGRPRGDRQSCSRFARSARSLDSGRFGSARTGAAVIHAVLARTCANRFENEFILQYRHTEEKPLRLDKMARRHCGEENSIATVSATKKVSADSLRHRRRQAAHRPVEGFAPSASFRSGIARSLSWSAACSLARRYEDRKSRAGHGGIQECSAQQENLGLALKKLTSADSERPVEPGSTERRWSAVALVRRQRRCRLWLRDLLIRKG